jgi:hypothetical protein
MEDLLVALCQDITAVVVVAHLALERTEVVLLLALVEMEKHLLFLA